MRTPIRIELTPEEQEELALRARGLRTSYRDVVRAKIILRVAEGVSLSDVAREVGRQRTVVRKWATRFVASRLQGLDEKPGRGRPPGFPPSGGHSPRETRL
jgi:transposase-like protein